MIPNMHYFVSLLNEKAQTIPFFLILNLFFVQKTTKFFRKKWLVYQT